jgi:hypothetical protein
MTTARLITVENRLAALFLRPGGKSVRDALGAADRRVLAKLADLATTMPATTARLRELVDAAAGDPDHGLDRIYEASNQVFALAGAMGFTGLADAAFSLCDLIEATRETGKTSWEAIRLHADAIRLLGAKSAADRSDAAIVAGLKELSAHLQRPAGSPDAED